MKPTAIKTADGAMASGPAKHEEPSLEEAYQSVGLLITESRLPEPSSKGRRQGVHVPSESPSKCTKHQECQETDSECLRVHSYKTTITQLCRNDIPLCIEVLLCPTCEREQRSGCCNSGSAQVKEYILLEQWTIQLIQNTKSDAVPQTLQNLVQAVRSHLCFSQLSAWLQSSKGVSPYHVIHRLTAPGEWFVHKFVMVPQQHRFPEASVAPTSSLGRQTLRVSLQSLPRMKLSPLDMSVAHANRLFGGMKSSNSPPEKSSGPSIDEDVLVKRGSSTPNETIRAHGRSKSVRGLHDLSDRSSCSPRSTDSAGSLRGKRKSPAQRCLNYSEPDSLSDQSCPLSTGTCCSKSPSRQSRAQGPITSSPIDQGTASQSNNQSIQSSLSAAERLASFSTLPTQSLNSLTLISCHPRNTSDKRATPPNKLPLSSGKSMPLKSPKVLFTRTASYGESNFFPLSGEDGDSILEPDPLRGERPDSPSLKEKDTPNLSSDPLTAPKFHELPQTSHNQLLKRAPHHAKQRKNRTSSTDSCSSNSPTNGAYTANNAADINLDTGQKSPESEASITNGSHTLNHKTDNTISSKVLSQPLHVNTTDHFNPSSAKSRLFNRVPLQSSPAPVKKAGKANFSFDPDINNVKAIKNAISCSSLVDASNEGKGKSKSDLRLPFSSSAPAFTSLRSNSSFSSSSSLLGNFEESLLNGRIEPDGIVEGFTVDIGASGAFCPNHVILPVHAYFFNGFSDDNAPSPYLGYVDLGSVGRRGYQIPRKGTLQITLFMPNKKVNKMFVVSYDLFDMPPRSQTFLRQKTVYAPCEQQADEAAREGIKLPIYLRYLIHLRFRSTKNDRIFLHTDIRLIYARDRFEFDSRVAAYEMRSFVEAPSSPKYSPIK